MERRPSGGEEREAACRGRRGRGSASPANKVPWPWIRPLAESVTEADMPPPMCDGCGLRLFHCVCDLLEPVPARTPMRIIRHRAERYKSSNTGGLLTKVLPYCQLIDHGDEGSPFDTDFLAVPNLVLVFPGREQPLPPAPTLLILDGTWPQVRKMMRRIPGLALLPRLSLPPPEGRPRMRASPLQEGMSTLEAAAAALAWVEDPSLAPPLLRLYDGMAERQLRLRGRMNAADDDAEDAQVAPGRR